MNNIIRFEIKRNFLTSLIWLLAIMGLIFLFYYIYPSIVDSGDDFMTAISNFPDVLLRAIGLENVTTLFSVAGFYAYIIGFIAIAMGIYSSNLFLNLFAKEKTKHINEYLFTKPIGRIKTYIAKSFVGILYITVIVVIYSLESIFLFSLNSDYVVDKSVMFNLNFDSYVLALFFGILTAVLIFFIKKVKVNVSVSLPLVVGFYGINLLSSLVDEKIFKYISPFTLMNTQDVVLGNSNLVNYAYIIFITFVLLLIGAYKYKKMDIK